VADNAEHTTSAHALPRIWVICDDRPGNSNQALGIAEALDMPFEVKRVQFGKHAKLPNLLRGASLAGVELKKSDKLAEPWPDIVIAAGRRLAPIARYIKKRNKGKTFTVQAMWPGFPAFGLDLITTPAHDGKKAKKNRVITTGAPHRITKEILEREGKMWAKSLGEEYPKPYISLLVGGSTKTTQFNSTHAAELGRMASEFAKKHNATLLVTTSRRTDEAAKSALKDAITTRTYFHDWENSRMNPYIAFLALSDAILVSGESVSMCTEACATEKPVFIYAPEDLIPPKQKRLHDSLFEQGYALPCTTKNLGRDDLFAGEWAASPNPADIVAKRVVELYFK
jgi:hypothetical protein